MPMQQLPMQQIGRMIGKPVGISFRNGQGTSGVLCEIGRNSLSIIEYLYQDQFAMKHYDFVTIQNVHDFPACPHPQHHQRLY